MTFVRGEAALWSAAARRRFVMSPYERKRRQAAALQSGFAARVLLFAMQANATRRLDLAPTGRRLFFDGEGRVLR